MTSLSPIDQIPFQPPIGPMLPPVIETILSEICTPELPDAPSTWLSMKSTHARLKAVRGAFSPVVITLDATVNL